jgi:hypothetical protein
VLELLVSIRTMLALLVPVLLLAPSSQTLPQMIYSWKAAHAGGLSLFYSQIGI